MIEEKGFRYYNLKGSNWTRKIVPHLGDPLLNNILIEDFNRFTFGTWAQPFKPGQFPDEFESCDWRCGHQGPYPRFWRYVKHSACHWIVNFALQLAQLVVPEQPWRILSSPRHSTVWDGASTLFDFNFQAMGITADACFECACGEDGEELYPGEYLPLSWPVHFSSGLQEDQFRPETIESFRQRLYGLFPVFHRTGIKACRAVEITPALIITWHAMADDPRHPAWRGCPPLWRKIVDVVRGHDPNEETLLPISAVRQDLARLMRDCLQPDDDDW
jgi:hypothetical protein